MIFTGVVLLLHGLQPKIGSWFKLSNSEVVSVLLGTTSLNVIAMVVAIIKGIFPKDVTKP